MQEQMTIFSKPIKPRVLLSRIKALLRRKNFAGMDQPVELKSLSIDRESLSSDQRWPRDEFYRKRSLSYLPLLISMPGKVFTRDHILFLCVGRPMWLWVIERSMCTSVNCEKEIGSPHIKTIKGVGYKFEE